jgi:hypothetical glycosyl hydrolase
MVGGKLRISPKFPADIESINFNINWKGSPLHVSVGPNQLSIKNTGEKASINLSVFDKEYTFEDVLEVEY